MLDDNSGGLGGHDRNLNPRRRSRGICGCNCARHFNALMRKNMIIWIRSPACSAFELLAPIILMVALTIIRMQVPVALTDQKGMLQKKWVAYPGVANINGTWQDSTDGDDEINHRVQPMYQYANYSEKHDGTPEDYSVGWDWHGPQFYAPSHCLKTFDFNRPKASAPLIAVIGNQTNITDSYQAYYMGLRSVQTTTAAAIAVPFYQTYSFDTIEEFNDYIESPDYKMNNKHKGVCHAIQHFADEQPGGTIDPDVPMSNNYTFSLHFPDKAVSVSQYAYAQGIPNQENDVWLPYIAVPDLLSYLRYQHNGFAFVQNLLAYQVLANHVGDYTAWISMLFQPLQTDTSVYDPFTNALGILMPLFLLLAYIPPVYNMTFKIVREKESRAKETMRIMGLTDLPYWMSWFVFYTFINTLMSTVAWGVLIIKVVQYSSYFYTWFFIWLYGQAVFGQIIFLQSMFTGSKYAGIVSTVVYFSGVLVFNLVHGKGDDVSREAKMFASLLPQVALMQGSAVFAQYEGTGVGLGSSTASVLFQNYSFNSALWMLLLDFFIFFLLGLYMDKVIPSDFGQRLNPCFLCTPSYYKCCRRKRRRGHGLQNFSSGQNNALIDDDDAFERDQMPPENYESPAHLCKRLEQSGDYLRIDNLQKTFSGGFRAVKGVNMKMYDSQIFALLGHNGAGKTTTISMLTGLIKKSQGSALCYDVDIFEEMDQIREFMGICPQHDVLFDLLTPREHLDIFYDFKGGDPDKKKDEINSLIADVGLTIDQRKNSHTLSGGNKRKLSVSIALCGGSKFVLLDEPTSGMDLGARRNLWDMLKSYKKDRIIVLTTHYMDEADVLGDRIGIMCKGTLQCIGSSLFLKNRFGVGYKITFVKKRRKVHPDLESFVASYFSGVQRASEVHEEISYIIPKNQAQNFGGFFDTLDQRLDEFDISSYGVSMSNLEDVFLKINQEFAPDLFGDLRNFSDSKNSSGFMDSQYDRKSVEGATTTQAGKEESFNKAVGHSTTMSAGKADHDRSSQESDNSQDDMKVFEDPADVANLIRGSSCARSCTASSAKRFIIYKRDWCGLLCQIVIPLILVLFGLWLSTGPSKLQQSPPRHMSTGWYPMKQRMIMNSKPIAGCDAEEDCVTGAELFANFPNSTSAFEVKYHDEEDALARGYDAYISFYNTVFENRNSLPLYPYRYGSFQLFQADRKYHVYNIIALLNVTSQDVTGLFPQYMYTAILRTATNDPTFTFDVTSVPFPIYQKYKDIEAAATSYDYVFMAAISIALIPCVMVQFILNERELQLKHQQLLSGMSLAGYWSSNMLFDIVMAYVPVGLILLLTVVFDKNYEGVWALFMLYPPAIVPYTYVWSFVFTSDINAQIFTLFLHFVAGGLLVVVVFVLQYVPSTMQYGDSLRFICCIFPSFCVTHAILFASSGSLITQSRMASDDDTSVGGDTSHHIVIPRWWDPDIWSWYNLKFDALALILICFISCIFLAMIEFEVDLLFDWMPRMGCRQAKRSRRVDIKLPKDDDVSAEEKRVAMMSDGYRNTIAGSEAGDQNYGLADTTLTVGSGNSKSRARHQDCIRVHNFQKEYDTFCGAPVRAVKQASFALDYGECFALLGVNGAGKSTTFKTLTRDVLPTTGEITIQGFDVQRQFSDARKLIGYCPQHDAIFPKLTVVETLKFFALIKGIRTHKIDFVVEKAIKDLNLKDHRNKLAGTLSGGNKRKLSVAMALIGNPPIILLDEPSAGMDPEARRFMWQVVERISQRDKKSAVILTTHSMEEAEALSTKLGIMVRGGVFRCMGSSQHIKNKFGVGYEVEIKVKKASYQDLEDLARRLGFQGDPQSKVSLEGAVQQLQRAQFDRLILDQIRGDGLGHDLTVEASLDEQGEVRLRNLLEYLKAQTHGFSIMVFLTRHFQQVEVLEQCGEYFKLRVPKEDKTIGWLFGQLEHEKRDLGIQEYSVTQTTLEQIFQAFANQSIASDKAAFTYRANGDTIMLENPDRRMTDDQEHYSQRGLSFHEDPTDQPPNLGDDEDGKGQLLLPGGAAGGRDH